MATSTSYVLDHKQILQAAEPERPNNAYSPSSNGGSRVVSPGKQQYLSNGAPSPPNKLSPRHIMSILNTSRTQLDVVTPDSASKDSSKEERKDVSKEGSKDDLHSSMNHDEEKEKEARKIKKSSPKTFAQFVGSSRVMAVQREASSGRPKKPSLEVKRTSAELKKSISESKKTEPSADDLDLQQRQRMLRRNSIGSMLTSSFRRSPTAEPVKEPSPPLQPKNRKIGNYHTISGATANKPKRPSILTHSMAPLRSVSMKIPDEMVDISFRNPRDEEDKKAGDDEEATSPGSMDDSDSNDSSQRSSPHAPPATSDSGHLPAAESNATGSKKMLAEELKVVEELSVDTEESLKVEMQAELVALREKFLEIQRQSMKKDEDTKKLEVRLKDSQACAKEYENAYKKLNDANTKLHEVNEKLTTEIKSVKGSLTDSRLEAGSLRAHLERLERECRNVKKSLSSLCVERNSLKLGLDKAALGQEDARKEAARARKGLEEAQTELQRVKESCQCGVGAGKEASEKEGLVLGQGETAGEGREGAGKEGEAAEGVKGKESSEKKVKGLREEVSILQKRVADLEGLLGLNEEVKEVSLNRDELKGVSELERKFGMLKKLFELEKARSKSLVDKMEDEKMSSVAEIAQHKQHLGHLQMSIKKMEGYVQQHRKETEGLMEMARKEDTEKEQLCSKAEELHELAEKCFLDVFGHQSLSVKEGTKAS